MDTKKIFVFDTNILLHDYRSIFQFEENDIVIPMSVIEELDKFKKGNEQINYNARLVVREIERLANSPIFEEKKGVKLGDGLGNLFVLYHKEFSKQKDIFIEDNPDNRILSVADYLTVKNPQKYVALVSKDINLRMKAKSLGINTEDYRNDAVKDIEKINRETDVIELASTEYIDLIYDKYEVSVDEVVGFKPNNSYNYYILKCGEQSILVHYNRQANSLKNVEKKKRFGIKPRNAEQAFAFHALMNEKINLISLTGKAGTGKTLLALASALAQTDNYTQILLARPIVSLSNRDLGFLPGNVDDKIGPYMQPLFDNLTFIKSQFSAQAPEYMKIENLLKKEKITISPLAYIRGRSLSNTFFIVDEAQNLTPHEVKTIITRAGENTKIIFTGDIQQIDSPYLDEKSNGIAYLSERMKNQDLFEHINLVHGERSRLAELASDLL
jgi:PhoH-like ATPase